MSQKRKKMILPFVSGFLATAFILPLLSALGVPSFNGVLVALFGEGSIWVLILSLLLILLLTLGVWKIIKRYD